jgi:hypothetical protein
VLFAEIFDHKGILWEVRIYWEPRPLRTLGRWVAEKEFECMLTTGVRTENSLKKLDAPLFCVPRNPSHY